MPNLSGSWDAWQLFAKLALCMSTSALGRKHHAAATPHHVPSILSLFISLVAYITSVLMVLHRVAQPPSPKVVWEPSVSASMAMPPRNSIIVECSVV